jgi:hypothetical protein
MRSQSSCLPRSIHTWKSTIQQKSKRSFATNPVPCRLSCARDPQFHEILRLAGNEEHRIADFQAKLFAHRIRALRSDVLRDRPRTAFSPSRQKM